MAKNRFGNKSSDRININKRNNEVELANISSDEDNEYVPIKQKRLIVLNYSSDRNVE